MEVVLYEFSFDYLKALAFLPIFIIGVFFFFADKLINKGRVSSNHTNISVKELSPKTIKIILRCLGSFCLIVFLTFSALHLGEYNTYRNLLKKDNVLIVQGYVESFTPLPDDGKGTENFKINGVWFAYNDADGTNGYTKTANRGGVITHNGQHLIIKYITNENGENIILYIGEFK